MTTLQQALVNAKLAKPISFFGTDLQENKHHGATNDESSDLILGVNHLGNKQWFYHGEEVCPRCLDRYRNYFIDKQQKFSMGEECDLCQKQDPY